MSVDKRSLVWWSTGFTGHSAKVFVGLLAGLFVFWSMLFESVLHGGALVILNWVIFRLCACLVSGNPRSTIGALWLVVMALSVAAVGFGAYFFTAFASVEQVAFPRRAHREAVGVLKSTDDPKELAEKVLPRRGAMLEFDDGSWLAIRYQDTHAFKVQSYILARCSDGIWLEGDHHFCAALPRLREQVEKEKLQHRSGSEFGVTNFVGSMTNHWMLADATNLDVARRVLKERFGFREVEAP